MADDDEAEKRRRALERARAVHLPMFFQDRDPFMEGLMRALLAEAHRRGCSPNELTGALLHFALSYCYHGVLCTLADPQRFQGLLGEAYTARLKSQIPELIDRVRSGYQAALETYTASRAPANEDEPTRH